MSISVSKLTLNRLTGSQASSPDSSYSYTHLDQDIESIAAEDGNEENSNTNGQRDSAVDETIRYSKGSQLSPDKNEKVTKDKSRTPNSSTPPTKRRSLTLEERQQRTAEIMNSSSLKFGVKLKSTDIRFANNLLDAVRIDVYQGDLEPVTIPDMFLTCVKQWKQRTALAYRTDAHWSWISYKMYYAEVLILAKVFIQLGLEPGCGVALACSNTHVYFTAALGAIFAGGFFVGIPCIMNQNQKHITQNIMKECKVSIVIVDKYANVSVVQDIAIGLPKLKAIVDLTISEKPIALGLKGKPINKLTIIRGSELAAIALTCPEQNLWERLDAITPNKCCAVFYPNIENFFLPTGVMYSHDNLTYMAKKMADRLMKEFAYTRSLNFNYRCVSCLPLNVPFAIVFEMFVPWLFGGLTAFANPNKKDGLIQLMREVQPHIFCASSRLWLNLQTWIGEKINVLGRCRRLFLAWSRRKNLLSYYQNIARYNSFEYRQPAKLGKYVSKKVKKTLGLRRCSVYISFGNDLRIQTLDYFISLNMPILEALCSPLLAGPHSLSTLSHHLIGSCGLEVGNFATKLSDNRERKGRLYCRGRHVCMGIIYPVSLRNILDKERYICTAIKAFKGLNNNLYIRMDKKDVLILRDGHKVQFGAIERMFKDVLPITGYCVIVGHHLPFLTILFTLRQEVNQETMHMSKVLCKAVQRWLVRHGLQMTTIDDAVNNMPELFIQTVDNAIQSVNKSMSKDSQIKGWKLLPKDFCAVDGEIDPITLEVHREAVMKKYRTLIDEMYKEAIQSNLQKTFLAATKGLSLAPGSRPLSRNPSQ